MEKVIELTPDKISTSDFEQLEQRLKDFFRREIYWPLLKDLGEPARVLNSVDDEYRALQDALFAGKVTFYRGVFSGRFNASVSKILRSLGATWDRRSSTYRILSSSLPMSIRNLISASETRFKAKLDKIDDKLAQILPEEIAGKFKCADIFDRTLYKTDAAFRSSVKSIGIQPKLSTEQRKKIADEWQNNMELWIKDFTKKEITQLRTDMQESVFAGDRYGSAVKKIQASYGVSERKAKFLARQETSLLMAKFQETQYQDAGIFEYKWGCVAGSKLHPVRKSHRDLEHKIFRWDDPPITTAAGEPARRNNPGQDYNCRCFAKPIVRVRK